jgi:predicted RND superfamily exporter protein
MDKDKEPRFDVKAIRDVLATKVTKSKDAVKRQVTNFDSEKAIDKLLNAPSQIRRELSQMTVFGLLTRAPLFTIIVCLAATLFFTLHSGMNDCRDGWEFDFCYEESSLNVNGDLAVYLPDGSEVAKHIETVEEDWTTNVMVIYVESEDYNVTSKQILDEMDAVERRLNWYMDDDGYNDNVIYILSISTVVKEVNSSAVRISKAFFSGVAEATGNEEIGEAINETIDNQQDVLGNYAIPEEQSRINQIIGELPENARKKLVRSIDYDSNGDGIISEGEITPYWNRAVIIVGISDELDKDGDGIPEFTIGELIANTQSEIDRVSEENNWQESNLTMTLTGPVPITNAVTEYSFKLFWKIFPVGIVAVALVLFLFHCDVLQTGKPRFMQGLKVVIITGLPTLCSVWMTLGIIGFTNYEVTMTVIIVGPIILALGVSYGLHITNRYAESRGEPHEKMALALQSTGRAVFLSAVTTVIGFISLTFTPMKPIQTVGWSLAGGIIVVYIMTMIMVPNLTMLLDLKKPSHPPPKLFVKLVNQPIKYTKTALTLFVVLMIFSAGISRNNIEENIELLEMAPEDEPSVLKMKTYSDEFDAGQPGFLLIDGNIRADPDFEINAGDPFDNLKGIEQLESEVNVIDKTTAVSIVFLMKAIAVSVNVSGDSFIEQCDLVPDSNTREVCYLIFDREQKENASFWEVLLTLDNQDAGGRQTQNFLLYVFYNSLTSETRELFIAPDYQRSLIYIDMPFMDVQSTANATNQIDAFAAQSHDGSITSTPLVGVASITIEVNELIVGSQWSSLSFALLFTLLTLGFVFRDARFAFLTTLPVVFTVFMQWLVMDAQNVDLSLVTVMIGSILVGVGVDFSIHIANRVRELGGTLDAIRTACASTGMSLAEAAASTIAGLACALLIPIPALKPFVLTIMVLLAVAAISALLLLPAIYAMMVKSGLGLTGGSLQMKKRLGLNQRRVDSEGEQLPAVLIGDSKDAW